MAYTHGSNTGTHGIRTQGQSNGDELREALRRRCTPGRSRPGYSGLGLDLAVVVAAAAALAAAAGILSIPKHCVAHLVEGEELWRWAAEALGTVVLPALTREPPVLQLVVRQKESSQASAPSPDNSCTPG